jgi:hypothetical protein
MKKFWTYIKHKRKDIVKMDGKLYCDPVTKSNILNRQFKSAFSEKTSYTTEEFLNSNRMNSTTTQHPNMKSFDITCNGITPRSWFAFIWCYYIFNVFPVRLSGYLLSMMFEIAILFLALMVTSFLLLFECVTIGITV